MAADQNDQDAPGGDGGTKTVAARARRAGAFVYATTFFNQGMRLVVFALLARLLTPAEMGVVALAMIAVTAADVFVNLAMTEAIVQRAKLEHGHSNAVLVFQLAIGGVLSAIVLAIAPLMAAVFQAPQIVEFMPYIAIVIMLTAASSVPNALLIRELRYGTLAIRSMGGLIAGSVVGLTMAFQGFGPWALIGQAIAIKATDVIILYTLGDWLPTFRFGPRHARDVVKSGGPMVVSQFAVLIENNLPRVIIGVLGGQGPTGLFTFAWRLVETVRTLVIAPLDSLWFPLISRLQDEPEKVKSATKNGMQLAIFGGGPAYAGLAAAAPVLVPFFFGSQWIPAVVTVQILALLGGFWSLTTVNVPVARAMGKPVYGLVINYTRLALTILLFIPLVMVFGDAPETEPERSAAGVLISERVALLLTVSLAINWVMQMVAVRLVTSFGVMQQIGSALPAIAASAVMFVAVSGLRIVLERAGLHDGLILLIVVPAGVVIYALGVVVLARAVVREVVRVGRERFKLGARQAKNTA